MSKQESWLDKSGKLLIRMGNNSDDELCVQIIMNIPLAELIADSLGKKYSSKKSNHQH